MSGDQTPSGALAAVRKVAEDHELDPAFPPEVDREVEALVADPGIADPALEDLTKLPFVTIDDESSKDLDQAAYVERQGEGYVVYYALADAAYYVKPGTALFAEALRRGASFYLPGFMVPMLPRALSEGIVSLNPDVDRRAMVFRMEVDGEGRCTRTQILSARIRSRAKLSFERVQAALDDPKLHSLGDDEIDESMRQLKAVGLVRMHDAAEREVVRYRRTEVDVGLVGGGAMRFVAGGGLRVPVERYNEQLSLLCNIEGAQFLRDGGNDIGVQPIYRVHPAPEEDRVVRLEALLRAIANVHGLPAKTWTWARRDERSLSDFLTDLPEDGDAGRIAQAVHRQAVMVNGRSCFRIEPGMHFGVGAAVYARFSAPMREIVGIFLHKETWEKLRGSGTPKDAGTPDDEQLREQVVEAANRAKDVQRNITNEANRLVLDQLFDDDLRLPQAERPRRRGTVMGLNRGKVYVLLDEPPIDVKVYVRHLQAALGDGLAISDDQVSLLGGDGGALFHTGEAVRVDVLGRDRKRDRWRLSISRDD